MGNNLVQAAVPGDQCARLFGADARHAGNVIGRVALETVEIGYEIGRDAMVEVVHALGCHDGDVGKALARGDHMHMFCNKLIHIAVTGDEIHIALRLFTAAGERTQNIVALPAFELDHGDREVLQQFFDHGELAAKIRIHGWTLGLVLGQHLHADLRTALVERADHAVGRELVDHLKEHVEEAEYCVGGAAVRRVHGGGHSMEGAVHERVAIDDGDDASGTGRREIRHGGPLSSVFSRKPVYPTARTSRRRPIDGSRPRKDIPH